MKIQNGQYPSINQLQDEYFGKGNGTAGTVHAGMSFQEILDQKTGTEVKFSKHASNRLTDRNISLSGEQMQRLNEGTRRAQAKGIQESLVLVDELAFIVNVPNNTVITAMDQEETKENVFTNIDGAVIMYPDLFRRQTSRTDRRDEAVPPKDNQEETRTMMRSLYSGVAGLKTHQTKMDVIGNNIANVNTVSYKSQSVTFNTLLYQTTQAATGANAQTGLGGKNAKQIGLGSKTGAISTQIDTAGSAQTTNNPFDIMITGDSFFIVNNGTSNYFTRDGSFYVDGAGNLCMSSTGYNVMGWQVDDETQTIRQDRVSALKIMDASKMTYEAEATTQGYISGIVDANDSNINSTAGKVISMLIYDNLGYQYSAKFTMHATDDTSTYYMTLEDILDVNGNSITKTYNKTSIDELVSWGSKAIDIDTKDTISVGSQAKYDATAKTISLKSDGTEYKLADIAAAGGNNITTVPATPNPPDDPLTSYTITAAAITADKAAGTQNGLYNMLKNAYGMDDDTIDSINTMSLDAATGEITVTRKSVKNSVVVSYNLGTGTFQGLSGDGTSTDGTAKLTFLDKTKTTPSFADISVDFTPSRQANNNKAATISATNGNTDGNYAGRKLGDMSGVTIGQDGKIYATYDNGCSRLLGQIAVANFANASGLSLEGDNLYAETQNSGTFDGVGSDITGNGGYMTTGELEMSNVDLSSEFTEMITTQRGFQANSRIITVSDTMLEELTNLKR